LCTNTTLQAPPCLTPWFQMTKFYHSNQEKNESTVFRVRVRAQFEWQNCSKVAFVFCINGPLVCNTFLNGTLN
jgi:hypothetical protein